MFPYLLILFTVIPAIELMIIIEVGRHIGSINTLLVIIITGVVGAALARLQGFIVLNKIQTNLNRGIIPSGELMDGLMILVGGVLLLTPGFVTDSVGLLLLFPATRGIIKRVVKVWMEDMVKKGQVVKFYQGPKRDKPYDDIDI